MTQQNESTTTQETRELKPCPFCGSGAFISWDGDTDSPNDWSAVCDNTMNCGADIRGMLSEDAARAAWNTRAPSDTEQRLGEALEPLVTRVEKMMENGPDCDCPAEGHICGWPALQRETRAARAALQPKAEPEQK